MRMTLAALILTLASAAALAQPLPGAPVINPPNPQSNVIISLGDYLTPGVSTYEAFKRARLARRQQKAAKLVIPTGRYVFDDAAILQHGGRFTSASSASPT